MHILKNNHGWSMKELLIYSAILVAFLLSIVFFVNKLYSNLEKMNTAIEDKSDGYSYRMIESNLEAAGRKYFVKHRNVNLVSLEELLDDNYISEEKMLSKVEDYICDGYVTKNDANYKAYIKCLEYETKGY